VLESPWLFGGILLAFLSLTYIVVSRLLRDRRSSVRRLLATVTAVAIAAAGTQLAAYLLMDHSGVARALVWRGADVDDWRRFPAAPIPAGEQHLELREGSLDQKVLEDVTRSDGSTADLPGLLERPESTPFLVLKDDVLPVEEYPLGGDRDDIATSFSMAKSFLSTALGIAIAEGEVASLDDPVTRYVPELADEDERFDEISLRHLVSMSSGLHYEEHGLPWSDDALTYYSPDLRKTALSAEVDGPPGEEWLYNNFNPLLVGLALERATGSPLATYVSEHLWQPMGAEYDASWSLDSDEHRFAKMESGFNARPVDYARFGYLFAHGGQIAGRQVVPEEWVQGATADDTTTDPAPHYQYFWWVDTARPHRFFARGNKGQFIYVDADADVVVVRTGRNFGIDDWPEVLRDVADTVVASNSS